MIEIQKSTISDQAADAVRDLILDGGLPERERINEVHLAAQLGVSRTPLREALNRVASEGLIDSRSRHGFFVRELTIEEFQQTYAVRPLLDPEALRLAGLPDARCLDDLVRINAAVLAAATPVAALAADDAFHLALIASCPNVVLLELIRLMMVRTRRYELALFRETARRFEAGATHEAIINALRGRDLERACGLLARNMTEGQEPIISWLQERKSGRRLGAA